MPELKYLHDEAATAAAAWALAPTLKSGDLVLLQGELGAGKSTFARALIRALPLSDGSVNAEETVPSPSYTLVQVYERALGQVFHFDLYRLSAPHEVWELGLEDALGEGLTLIEWPERLGALTLPVGVSVHLQDAAGRPGRLMRLFDARTPRDP